MFKKGRLFVLNSFKKGQLGYFLKMNLIIVLLSSCSTKEVPPPPVAYGAVPTSEQLAWHEMETNVFVHYTTNTFTDMEWGYGDESPEVFNPSNQDVDQWMQVFKEAGFKGVVFTTKHHDGFCLWPSEYTEHSLKHSPYKNGNGDVVKEVAEACERHGLKFGVYISPWDRNHPNYGGPEYIAYYRNQLQELFTQYGPIFQLWFDGANGGDGYYGGANEIRNVDRSSYYDWPTTLKMVSEIQPNTLLFSDAGPMLRWCGNEEGIGGEPNWNLITPDTLYAGKPGISSLLNTGSEEGSEWVPSEVNTSIRPGWFYHGKEDSLVKTPEQLFEIYLSSVGRGSTLLLNVPPDNRGLIHENDIRALKEWRKLIDEAFKTNLALNKEVIADAFRGNVREYGPTNVTDNNPGTYWTTDDDQIAGSLEIDLGQQQTVQYIVLKEHIQLGQRVKSFSAEVLDNDGKWQEVASGKTIGFKRILKIDPVNTSKVRVNIVDSRACPIISSVEIY